ncbi:MAG: calcium-binding EGF-like domain-containing protein [Cytophagales bacterium]
MFVAIVLIVGCSKEEAEEVQVDPCEKIICENDGVCIDGKCECKHPYTGQRCDSQITPTSIFVDSIMLMSFPATNNGIPWDAANGPDIYLSFSWGFQSGSYLKGQYLGIYNDAVPGPIFTYKENTPLIIEDSVFKVSMSFSDFEYENGGSQGMSDKIEFMLYTQMNNFPDTLLVSDGQGFDARIHMRYAWD